MTKITPLNRENETAPDKRRIHLREISGDSETPLETVGQDLRAARLRRGDDLATVSRALKIRKDHLEAVEQDDLKALPGKTYAIGFVRTYATYLGLDTTATVERYKQEITGRHDEHMPPPVVHDYDSRKLTYGWRIVAAVVCLALAYGAYHLFSAGSAPQPVPPAPALTPPRPVAQAKPPVAAQQTINAQPAQADNAPANNTQPGNAPADQNAAKPGATAQQLANTVNGGEAAATPSAGASAAVPSGVSPGHIYGAQNKNARVVLRARADTHIEVRGQDGRIFINRNLSAGDSYNVPNVVGVTLTASDAGAVEVDLDGLAMGRAGADQQSGDLQLDPQTIADHKNGNH